MISSKSNRIGLKEVDVFPSGLVVKEIEVVSSNRAEVFIRMESGEVFMLCNIYPDAMSSDESDMIIDVDIHGERPQSGMSIGRIFIEDETSNKDIYSIKSRYNIVGIDVRRYISIYIFFNELKNPLIISWLLLSPRPFSYMMPIPDEGDGLGEFYEESSIKLYQQTIINEDYDENKDISLRSPRSRSRYIIR